MLEAVQRAPSGDLHGFDRDRAASAFRYGRLAYAAGDHGVRLPDRHVTFGPRSPFGFFMQPMSREFSWGRDVFGLALAIQNLLWGIGQPICRRDRRPVRQLRVMSVGARAVCRRPDHDALCRDAALARSQRRRPDRLWTVRLFVQPGAVGVRQTACRRNGAASRSAPAPRPARSGNSCLRRSASR